MSAREFLSRYKHLMLVEERQELEKGTFETIHFGGLIPQRQESEMPLLRSRIDDRIADFN